MIRLQDVGVLGYGGLVTGLTAWDEKRIEDGTITEKDLVKKAGFWGYLVPGSVSLFANAFGWMRRYEPWTERLSHGFIYGFPAFVKDVVDIYKEEPVGARGAAGGAAAKNAAVMEAQKLLAAAQGRQQVGGGAVGAAVGVTPGIFIQEEEILA